MHQESVLGQIGSLNSTLDEAVKSGALQVKQPAPRLKFVGFKIEGVPENRITMDIRGRVNASGKITMWQSGVALIAPDDVAHDAPVEDILKASRLQRWVLSPGRLVNLEADRPFGGLRLHETLGFVMPRIVPANKVRMYCPCGKDSFYTWSPALARAEALEAKAKAAAAGGVKVNSKKYDDLPRLHCSACRMRLNAKPVFNQPIVGSGAAMEDPGYAQVDHPDIQGFMASYHSEDPVMGHASLFPRMWAVYDAHQAPDVWVAQDELAAEIQVRFALHGKTIRPLESMVNTGGKPAPTSFVLEARKGMTYGWLEEQELRSHKLGDLDYPKMLVGGSPQRRSRKRRYADTTV